MDTNLEVLKTLYQDEIDAYKRQVDELKSQNKESHEKNTILIDKVRQLNDIIEQAKVTNDDLLTAFDHIRQENLKLQSYTGSSNQDNRVSTRVEEDSLALETVQRQNINLALESVSWISEKDKLIRRVRFLERECERYTRDNNTLGKQVRHLVRALEEERGMIIRRAGQVTEYGAPVSGLDVIDNHLVTFESIEEMQSQNQKLLSLVKELSKREEERETQVENEDIKRLNSDIEALKSQLEVVQNDRERIMNAFNTIIKERDLFKILLCKTRQVEHLTPEIFQRMVSIACSSGPAIASGPEDTRDKDAHITDLKAMITKLEQEITDLREEFETTRNKDRDEIKLKTDLLEEARMKILSETQQADIFRERNQLLESNAASLLKEFDEYRTKLQKLTFELEQLEKDKKALSIALEEEKQKRQCEIQLRERNQLFESQIASLMQELDEYRTKSHRLTFQIEHLEENKRFLSVALEEEKQKRQCEIQLQERNQLLESNVASLMQELDNCRTKLFKLSFELEQLEKEKKVLSASLEQKEVAMNDQKEAEKKEQKEIEKEDKKVVEKANQKNVEQENQQEREQEIRELQRLRNIERFQRLEVTKKYHILLQIPRHPLPKTTKTSKLTREVCSQTDPEPVAAPARGIVLKRRKIL